MVSWDTGDVIIIAKKIFGYRWCENCTNKSIIPFTPPAATVSAAVTIRILLTKFCILLLSFNVQQYSRNIWRLVLWLSPQTAGVTCYYIKVQMACNIGFTDWELCNTAFITDRQTDSCVFTYIFSVLNSYKCMLRLKLLHISPF